MSGPHKHPAKKGNDRSKAGEMQRDDDTAGLSRRHSRFGWWSLLVFLSLGIGLEALHGLKVGWYLDLANTTRRHMWTLAHTHGTLIALINLIYGATLHQFPAWRPRKRSFASACLLSAGILMPAGFFLGGLRTYDGDPGVGIVLVPVGGLLLFLAVLMIARARS